MTNKKSLFEGYPFGPAKSLELFPLNERPVGQQIDAAIKDNVLLGAVIIKQYSEALHEAEEQIKNIQAEYPFLPEDYGFKEFLPELPEGEEHNQMSFSNIFTSRDENIRLEKIHDHTWRIKINSRAIPDPANPGQEIFIEANIDTLIHVESEQEMYQFFKIMGVLKSIQPVVSELPEGSEKIGDPIDIQLNNGAKIQSLEELRPEEPTEEIQPFTA